MNKKFCISFKYPLLINYKKIGFKLIYIHSMNTYFSNSVVTLN